MKTLHQIGLTITTTNLTKERAEDLLHYLDTNNIPTKPVIVEYQEEDYNPEDLFNTTLVKRRKGQPVITAIDNGKKIKYKKRKHCKYTIKQEQEACMLKRQGHDYATISKKTGIKYGTLTGIFNHYNLLKKHRKPYKQYPRHEIERAIAIVSKGNGTRQSYKEAVTLTGLPRKIIKNHCKKLGL